MKCPALLWMLMPAVLSAQPMSPPTPAAQLELRDFDIFAALLKHHGLVTWESHEKSPLRDTVVVIFGPPPAHQAEGGGYINFVRNCLREGGAVLFATDQACDLSPYLGYVLEPVTIHGGQVRETDPGRQHRFLPECPVLRLLKPSLNIGTRPNPDSDLLPMLGQPHVVANKPSFISGAGAQRLKPLALYHDTARLADGSRPDGPVMAMLPDTRRLAVILADAGVLSNQMLAGDPAAGKPALSNFDFASHLVSYLIHGPDGQRRRQHVVFLDHGKMRRNLDSVQFDVNPNLSELAQNVDPSLLQGAQPSWAMIQQSFAKGFDDKLNELQDKDWPTSLLPKPRPGVPYVAEDPRRDRWREIMQKIGGAFAVLAVILVLRRLMGQRKDGEPVLVKEPAAGPATLRDDARALLRGRRLHELLPAYLHSHLDRWGAAAESPVAADGPPSYRKQLAADLARLRAAVQAPPARLSPAQWRHWHALAERLDADHAAGRWHIEHEGPHA